MAEYAGAPVVVAIPGTGSDADFARRAFGPACAAAGLQLQPVQPDPAAVVTSCRAALDRAARGGPVVAAGISLGAGIAVQWAAERGARVAGVVAALPAWTGHDPGQSPAARNASATAAALRAEGLAPVLARMQASSPSWLAAALTASWTAQWPQLPDALAEAAAAAWPDVETLAGLPVPVTVVTAVDDPVHPLAVAQQWAELIPECRMRRTTLDAMGADPGVLGMLGLDRWLPPERRMLGGGRVEVIDDIPCDEYS